MENNQLSFSVVDFCSKKLFIEGKTIEETTKELIDKIKEEVYKELKYENRI